MRYNYLIIIALSFFMASCNNAGNPHEGSSNPHSSQAPDTTVHYKQEKHLKNIKQLTNGGDIAEAYFSFDDSMIVFQAKYPRWDAECDQIFYFPFRDGDMIDKTPKMLSEGLGRTTCSYFMPGDTTVLYASTRSGSDKCPPNPEKRTDGKYVWPIYPDFDIYIADLNGYLGWATFPFSDLQGIYEINNNRLFDGEDP